MKELLALLILGAGIYAAYWFLTRSARQTRQLVKETLTLQQYLAKYPACATSNGVKCAACGSNSIKNWGLSGATDPRRLFLCNHCNTRLYRSDDW